MLESYPDILTTEEVCEILRVKPLTVYEYIKSGRLPAIRIGKRYRIEKSKLIEFLEAASTGGEQKAAPRPTPKPAEAMDDEEAKKVRELFES